MKKYSKVLALLLSFMLLAVPMCSVSADSVTITAGGEALGETLDLAQKSIEVNFDGAVNESTLAEGVTLEAVGKRENVLHLTQPTTTAQDYRATFTYNFSSIITGGIVEIIYDVYYSDTTRYPKLTMYGDLSGADQSLGTTIGLKGANVLYAGQDGHKPDGMGDTLNKWNTVKLILDLTNKKYSFKVNDTDVLVERTMENASKFTDKANLKYILFNDSASVGALDILYKNISISYTAENESTSTVYSTDLSTVELGTKPSFFTYGDSVKNNSASCVVKNIVTEGNTIEVARSLSEDDMTYTLTYNGDWDTSKDYLLTVGTGVTYSADSAAVLTEAIEKSFVVRNLTGSVFTLDDISTTKGDALADGGFVPVSAKGIDLTFSSAVESSSLSGITLQKKTIDRVLNMTMPEAATRYTEYNWELDMTALTTDTSSGKYTVTASVIVDTNGYDDASHENYNNTPYLAFLSTCESAYTAATIKPLYNRITSRRWTGSAYSETDCLISEGKGLPKGKWMDLVFEIDLDANTYSCTATDPVTQTAQQWASQNATKPDIALKTFKIGIYNDEEVDTSNAGKVDISWKNIKMMYTPTNGTASSVFDINTDTETLDTIKNVLTETNNRPDASMKGTSVFNNEYESPAADVDVDVVSAPGSSEVSIIPKAALDYLGRYTLTVPTTVMNSDSTALNKAYTLGFTAIYSDYLYSAASGFTAGGSNITEISSTYTGDIIGWADVTNISGSPQDAVVVVALYKDGKLVDVDMTEVDSIGSGETENEVSGTVTIESDSAGTGYQAAVYVWESVSNMIPASVKTTTK